MGKKIVAFAGSNSSWSINRKLVKYVLTYFKGFEQHLLDLNDYEMDIFSVDREKEGYPGQAYRFREQMEQSDMIICSLAENNRTYSAAFKNILDWCSRIDRDIFRNRPMLLLSTSPGSYGGGNVLSAARSFFPKCGADIIETFSLPRYYDHFDDLRGIMTHPELKTELEAKIGVFKDRLEMADDSFNR